LGDDANLERVNTDRLGDILKLRLAEIGNRYIETSLNLPICVLRKTDRPGIGDAFQSSGDVDAVAHQIAVRLLDDVADMDADAKDDAPVFRHAGVALNHRGLHFDGAAYGIDDAAEFDDRTVARAFYDTAVVDRDGRINEIAAQGAQPRENAVLVGPGERL
jgi:hypothetical protein